MSSPDRLTYRGYHPADEIDTLDLWESTLPHMRDSTINTKYALLAGRQPEPGQTGEWKRVEAMVDQLKAADKLLFSVPMWNLNVPYVMKHYIDIVTQPGLTFSFSPATGYRGLLTGKRATVIFSSSGDFLNGTSFSRPDFQKPYVREWLRFIGVTDVEQLVVAPTAGDPEKVRTAMESALRLAMQAASLF